MIQTRLFDHYKETLEIRIYCHEPDWRDTLASKMMELSLQGWWYESYNFSKEDYTGFILDLRFIRLINGSNTTNIDASIIEELISL